MHTVNVRCINNLRGGTLSGKLKVDKPLPKYVFRDPALPRLASSWLCLGSIRTFYVYDA